MENRSGLLEQETSSRQFAKVCEILDHHQRDSKKLITILQEVQNEYRYLPEPVLTFIATALDVPAAKVYGVATFYSHFTLEPRGKYVIRVCDGTACHVKGSNGLVDVVRSHLKLTEKQKTTADMLFTLETVSCLGACGLAPVVLVNEEVYGQVTEGRLKEVLDGIIAKEKDHANA